MRILKNKPDTLCDTSPFPEASVQPKRTHVTCWRGTLEGCSEEGGVSGDAELGCVGFTREHSRPVSAYFRPKLPGRYLARAQNPSGWSCTLVHSRVAT